MALACGARSVVVEGTAWRLPAVPEALALLRLQAEGIAWRLPAVPEACVGKRRALRGACHEPFLFDSARGKIRGSVSCIRFTSRQGSFSSSLRMYTLLSFSV